MDLPTRLQRMQSQRPDLTNTSATFNNSANYTYDSLPRKIPLSWLPGQKFLDGLQEMVEFRLLRTNAEVTFDSDGVDTGEWRPQYYIGGGSHGKVGVWVKRNAKGEVIDEIALKEVQLQPDRDGTGDHVLWSDSRKLGLRRRLLAEAVMQSQLNQSNSESKNFCINDFVGESMANMGYRFHPSPGLQILQSRSRQ